MKGALRASLDVERAADILWTLNHPDPWQLLVTERGWTAEQWEACSTRPRASSCWLPQAVPEIAYTT